MIRIKTPYEIEQMRHTCLLAAQTLRMIEPYIQVGVTTQRLNDICHQFILDHGAIPSPLNYRGFPKSICTSVNQQVCHGIPSSRVLREGDIINVDITTNLNGFHGDTSRTFAVGVVNVRAAKCIEVARNCLEVGIRAVRPGGHVGDIGAAIANYAQSQRCSVVREYCGHGIGRDFHEDPAIMHFGEVGQGALLRPGMIFTIEPMINLGKAAIRHLPDKWTVVTQDHSLSAQFEHTVLITPDGYEVLTDIDQVDRNASHESAA
ncbi:MAG: type I methionyl aminopeptidase [Magnetococcales bacterium]|nr:type I methionyl aminopeptidase [Magnetococcales bacterium]